jgi:type II secretory pathway pseudopilin PulG
MKVFREDGYTIVESLVAIFILSITSVGFYSVLFAGTRASQTTEDVARVSEEARAGLNRMIRDTREGQLFSSLASDSYNVRIDFDGDGIYENPNEVGDYENLNFTYVASNKTIRLNNEVLVRGVELIPGLPLFSYTSNDLRYDWDGNGVTTQAELGEAGTRGYAGVSASDTSLYSNVHFAFRVRVGERASDFRGQAQLRNRR